MLKDRGNIKWTSLMLPEHVEQLKKVWKEDERVTKGVLAEDEAMEIDFKLKRAFNDDLTVQVKYHNGFDYSYTDMKLLSVDRNHRTLKGIDHQSKESITIKLDDVFNVQIM
ncbi:YolD-like family protein [Pontibacillus litoralis]|uniref:YolD-like protein n=1 Tax=Pontibacillus litoralis JSM 072002 TaxID=1385512 RepID=A0A0A5G4H7_9BACI|nr:YolD-like family protein [Pontibacillus litoralis]KGX87996.1 hypothetical protein N784_12950 [Pontibacillus litoralis JSM 072002]